jgi:nucleotide-binding universal stress UspA family protein
MNKNNLGKSPPATILLATDLSARCDRALDRAAQLAKEWLAKLIALNVIDVPDTPDQVLAWVDNQSDDSALNIATKQMARDVSDLGITVSMQVIRSVDTAATIQETALATASDMIVTGMARNEILGRFLLGSTVSDLSRSVPTPLLIVRNRVHGPYQRILVTTDFSEHSRQALLLTSCWFPARMLTVYHAHEAPFSGLSSKHVEISSHLEQGEFANFIKNSNLPANTAIKPAVDLGMLAPALTQYVRDHDIDLVVIGSNGNRGLIGDILGSNTSTLLDWLPCDTLVVRSPTDIQQ